MPIRSKKVHANPLPKKDPPSLAGEEFLLVHAASQRALQAQMFDTWPGDKSGWGGPPFSNISDTAEFKSLSPLSDASRFRWSTKGDTIHLAERPRLGFEATFREFDFSGNRVMLWGPHHFDVTWYSTFKGNSDGTISPKQTSKDLVLGFGKCLQEKHGFRGDRDQCILVPRGDARQLVVRSASGSLDADYFSFKTGGDPSMIVDRFRAARAGDTLTFYRSQPHPGPGAQPGSVPCESYTVRGDSLHGPVSGTRMPNGDIAWSHGYTSRRMGQGAEPSEAGRGGRWTEYTDIDMCGQGDMEIIPNWRSHTTIEELKRTVEAKGYSAITVSNGHPSFGHAALKKFPYQLTKDHCRPISTCCRHPCKIYIYDPTAAAAAPTAPAEKALESGYQVDDSDSARPKAFFKSAAEVAEELGFKVLDAESSGDASRPKAYFKSAEQVAEEPGYEIRKPSTSEHQADKADEEPRRQTAEAAEEATERKPSLGDAGRPEVPPAAGSAAAAREPEASAPEEAPRPPAGSAAAAARGLRASAADEARRRLEKEVSQLWEDAKLSESSRALAVKWCDDNGVVALMEILGNKEEFVEALQLKKFEQKRLLEQLIKLGDEMLEEAESEPEEEGEEVKYSVIHLVFGHPAEVTKGVEALLGITTQERISGEEKGLDAIWEEVKKAGTEKDCANLQYILHAVAQEESSLPPHVVEDYKNGCYHGGRLAEGDYDFGHAGMTFQSFMEREEAKLAGLNEPELCSIRLYTTSSFPLFNRPLRQGVKPHPMAITVYFLINGIKKLRAVAASKPGFQDEKRLYRGMKNADLDLVKFKAEGGAEFAAMSTTPTLEVAHSYSRSNRPLLFMFLAKGLSKGVEISWCSVYPKEDEVLYPPGTFLRYVRDKKDPEGTKIIQIEPQIP